MTTIVGYWHTLRLLLRELRGVKLEPEVPFMDRFLETDSVCIHIGASDGRHALHMARIARDGRVYCIEPSPFTLSILRRLKRIFRLPNLRLYNSAIGDQEKSVYLVTPVKKNGHKGRAFAFVSDQPVSKAMTAWDAGFTGFENEEVPMETLDSFCDRQGITRVDFLRCDIEGAEALMLDGARETLAAHRPVLLMEIHPLFLSERFGRSAEEIWQWLAELDYRVYYLQDGRLIETTRFLDVPWKDYFFVPAGKVGQIKQTSG